jgi:hypothetical protein
VKKMCDATKLLPLVAFLVLLMSAAPKALAYDTAFAKGCVFTVGSLPDDQLANFCACLDRQIENSGLSQQAKDIGRLLISIVAMPRPHPKLSAEEMDLVRIMSPFTNSASQLCLMSAMEGKLSADGTVLK